MNSPHDSREALLPFKHLPMYKMGALSLFQESFCQADVFAENSQQQIVCNLRMFSSKSGNRVPRIPINQNLKSG